MKYTLIIVTAIALVFLILFTQERQMPDSSVQEASDHNAITITEKDTLPENEFPFHKTENEWKQILTSKQYRILRKGGTEFPFTNEYNNNKREGIYVCAGCGQKLYSSEHKYDSGSGWPSFWKPLADSLVAEREDNSLFMTRTEIVCSNCGGHLGHVFDDGPPPTGLRYCMNSAAMDFIEKDNISALE